MGRTLNVSRIPLSQSVRTRGGTWVVLRGPQSVTEKKEESSNQGSKVRTLDLRRGLKRLTYTLPLFPFPTASGGRSVRLGVHSPGSVSGKGVGPWE